MTTPPDLDQLLRQDTIADVGGPTATVRVPPTDRLPSGAPRPDSTPEEPGSPAPPIATCGRCGRTVDVAWATCAWCGQGLAAPAELPPGTPLQAGRFVVQRTIGRGGFGITYATDDRRLQRTVAIKELFPGPSVRIGRNVLAPPQAVEGFVAARERFLREATVLARFSHPGIVRVFEVFEENGTAYLVMELLDGCTLGDLLAERGGPLSEVEALDVGTRCARALAVLHDGGVLHRDLNPANVMVTSTGRVALIDFGLARDFVAEATGSMTRLVTPGYAPPEQYLGHARFGPPTDVYGLAATLYRAMTGRAPVAALDRQNGVVLPVPHRLNRSLSRVVSDGLMDGLELQADHRPRTMVEFLARLGVESEVVPPRSLLLDPPTSSVRPVSGSVPVVPLRGVPASAPPMPPPQGPPWRAGEFIAPLPAPGGAPGAQPAAPATPAPPPVPGRWKVEVPVLAALAALGSAIPVLIVPVLVLGVLPAVSTAGDALTFVQLRRHGSRLRWVHRVALPAFVASRYVRNLVAGLYTAIPAVVVASATVGLTLLLDGVGVGRPGQELVLRPGGVAVALLLTVPVLRDRRQFRAAVIADLVLERLVDREGRLQPAGRLLWLLTALVVAVGFGFRPELWPLGP